MGSQLAPLLSPCCAALRAGTDRPELLLAHAGMPLPSTLPACNQAGHLRVEFQHLQQACNTCKYSFIFRGVLAEEQPGQPSSSIKPLVYACAGLSASNEPILSIQRVMSFTCHDQQQGHCHRMHQGSS